MEQFLNSVRCKNVPGCDVLLNFCFRVWVPLAAGTVREGILVGGECVRIFLEFIIDDGKNASRKSIFQDSAWCTIGEPKADLIVRAESFPLQTL